MKKEALSLFGIFFKVGAVTFGGGYAMLPILEKELVDKRHLTTRDELMDFYAISQTTPGVIAVNVATFIGCEKFGILGGIFATLGVITPSIIIITVIASTLTNFAHIPAVQKALSGINIAVAALITKSFFTFFKRSVKGLATAVIFLTAFGTLFFLNAPSFVILLCSSLVGLLFLFFRDKIGKGGIHE